VYDFLFSFHAEWWGNEQDEEEVAKTEKKGVRLTHAVSRARKRESGRKVWLEQSLEAFLRIPFPHPSGALSVLVSR
jgi:hypothetical protein